MRDPNRLYKFYSELQKIQFSYFPNKTFEEFLYEFLEHYNRDPFFPEEDEFLKAVEAYGKDKDRDAGDWDGHIKYDPETYDKFRDIHMKAFPDWRFGQLLVNFLGCIPQSTKLVGEKKLVKYLDQFAHGDRPHD